MAKPLVAIVGRPNVGKSSILNKLLDYDKAIVTDIAGTTRDIVEGEINLDGILLKLVDTAGIRETDDIVEKIGVNRSLEELENADLIIVVLNNNEELSDYDKELLDKVKNRNSIVVINKCDLERKLDINLIDNDNIIEINTVEFDKIDVLFTSDYLREAIQNSNYSDLAIKYAKGANYDIVSKYKTPINEVAANLSVQYRDKLSPIEQGILVLYNNEKYRKLCDAILNIPDFEKQPIKKVLKVLNTIKGFSKIKSECFDSVKRRIDDPVNQKVKASLFSNFDFTTFDTFIESLIKLLVTLKSVNEKMVLNGDINMYVNVRKVDELKDKLFVMTTNNLPALIENARVNKSKVCITLLKEGMPVLYSPYCFDLGDIYGKNVSPEMYIKEMVNFELLIDVSDIEINVDPNEVNVAKYYSEPNIVENLYIVDDIKMSYKTVFCKCAFTSKLNTVVTMNQSAAVASNVSPVVNSVFDAGTLASMAPPMENIPEVPVSAEAPKEVELPKVENDLPMKKEEVPIELPKVNETVKDDSNKDKTDIQVKDEKDVTNVVKKEEQGAVQSTSVTSDKQSNSPQVVKKVVVKQVAPGTNTNTTKTVISNNTTSSATTTKVVSKPVVQNTESKVASPVTTSVNTVKTSNGSQVVKKVVVKQAASSTSQNTVKSVTPQKTPVQGTNPTTKVVVKQVVKPASTVVGNTSQGKTAIATPQVNKQTPVVLHRAVFGSIDRFMAYYLEETKGYLPVWLAPKQVEVVPVNIQYHEEYSKEVYEEATFVLNLIKD